MGLSRSSDPPAIAATAAAASPPHSAAAPASAGANVHTATAGTAPTSPPQVDTVALAEAIAELQAAGAIDDATRQRLVEDLKRTDPALWPQLLQYFRSSLAYRQQADARRAAAVAGPIDYGQPSTQHRQPVNYDNTALAGAHSSGSTAAPNGLMTQPAGLMTQATAGSASPAPSNAPALLAQRESLAPLPPVNAAAIAPLPQQQPSAAATYPLPAVAGQPKSPDGNGATVRTVSAQAPVEPLPLKAEARAAASSLPEVLPAKNDNWQSHLEQAIAGLQQETIAAPQSPAEISRHAKLRMLCLAAGKRDDALRPIEGIPACQQDFWSKELFGLSAWMDVDRNTDAARRAAEANLHLRDASTRLSEMAILHVKNLAFCTAVTSYGVYKKFERYDFTAGQEVLLYAEVENFKAEPSEKGYHTALKSSYQILDAKGARVADQDFTVTEEYCQNQRRDFFVRYFVWLPKKIYGGKYTLQLTVEDTLGQKIGSSALDFTIDSKPVSP